MKIEIKKLDNSDSENIVDLILPIQQLEFAVPITLNDQKDLLDIEEFYIKTGGNFWGAFTNGELCGTIALLTFGKNRGAIRKMFVKKEYRGKEFGIAAALVVDLIKFCHMNGIEKLYLGTVDILKAAIRFYEKRGFVPVKKEDLPEDFPVMPSDNVFYCLDL